MKLKEMIEKLRTINFEKIELRSGEDGNEILTCPTTSKGWEPYKGCEVIEWFPHGAPNKDATFTVYIKE